MSLRIVFMGTPDFAVPVLSELIAAGHDIAAVYCQPPRPAGRGMAETPSPVHAFAATSGLDVLAPVSLKPADVQARFAAHEADAAVVVAYGLLLPQPVLDAPRLGCFNLHASALPRWRGAAPIQRAIMAGDTTTAVMVMRMEAGLDTGPVCLAEHAAIGPEETAGQLHDRLSGLGASLMVRAMAALEREALHCTPQPTDGVTYAGKIDKAEAVIDLTRPAKAVHDHVRGLSPFPGAWLDVEIGGKRERLKVLRTVLVAGSAEPGTVLDDRLSVACGAGAVRFVTVQRAGKRPMSADELLRGFAIPQGTRLC